MKKTDSFDFDIDSLIAGYLSGNASEEESLQLSDWVNQSDKNKRYFRSFCDIWQLSAGLNHSSTEEEMLDLRKINVQIDHSKAIQKEYQGKSRFFTFLKYAASILVILGIGYSVGQFTSKSGTMLNNAGKMAVIYAPMGSKAISILPDGTQVWLNAGSKIEYNTQNYDVSLREVTLTGEAYFKVKTNPAKPFVVKAKGINVKAIGTEFNVKAYPEETQVVTTLVKGIVKIEGKDKNQKDFVLEMKPKQIVTLIAPASSEANLIEEATVLSIEDKNQLMSILQKKTGVMETPVVVNNVNTRKYTSWKDNQWILEGEEIGNLLVMLERRFNVKIRIESPELLKYKFTGTFRNETLEQVLSVLKIATPMKYTIGKGTVTMEIDPALKEKYRKLITE